MNKEKILISACLVGDNVKYNGGNNLSPYLERLCEIYDLVPFCPEVEGGLPVPRDPSEIKGNRVVTSKGKDVTKYFNKGAELALNICKYLGITKAILKENSPSCGVHYVYDGSFKRKKIKGSGITTSLLIDNGIRVYSEEEIEELLSSEPPVSRD
ncbi:MAG: DUF523 domain-containing protein [Coprobacillus sp.]|nr:DUF523 domain-containing protein [Coprobacillus sp.]